MNSTDMMNNFRYVSICRELTQDAGWNIDIIEGEWKGVSSAGYPGKPCRQVPQFRLTITQPCSAYVSLTQLDDTAKNFTGKNSVGWMVVRLDGKLMNKFNPKAIVASSGNPVNYRVISKEVEFQNPGEFTVVCGSFYPGEKGEGKFELKVYARDPRVKIARLNYIEE